MKNLNEFIKENRNKITQNKTKQQEKWLWWLRFNEIYQVQCRSFIDLAEMPKRYDDNV